MDIKRDSYLQQLISYRFDGLVKVITGIRRCGKSYLLKNIYKEYLLQDGVKEEQIIVIELDLAKDIKYRNPLILSKYVREIVENSKEEFYLFVDEIQMSDEVPNPYNEEGKKITFYDAFDDYAFYGGMPLILSRPNDAAKMTYLKSLFTEVYIKDIVERKKIERQDVLEQILDLLCSSVGSLTNPTKIADTLRSKQTVGVAANTIRSYIGHLEDAFLFSESKRYDVKGKSYFDSPNKYYSEDIGLRNARIGFRQQEMTHIMENIIYNELMIRQFSVDVGVVYARTINQNGNSVRTPREIDFVVTSGGKKTYIQSAYSMPTEEKAEIELRPFSLTGDSFPKIVVRKDIGQRWYNENGILNINLIDFLLDKELI